MLKSKKKDADLSEPFYTFYGRLEMANIRLMLISGIVILSLAIIIAFQWNAIGQKDKLIAWLENNRVMIGFANEDGVFQSADKRPEEFIVRYAKTAALLRYTYSPLNIAENMEELRKMYDYRIALQNEEAFKEIIRSTRRDSESSMFIINQQKIEEKKDRFIVHLRGEITRYASRIHVSTKSHMVTVHLAKLQPSPRRPEGLSIMAMETPRQRR